MFVLVQTADQCREVVADVLTTAAPGTTVAVMATVPPDVVVELAATAADEVGVDLIDAPFAGQGVESVRSHTMTVLGGGEAEVVERLRPVVEPALGRLVHAGPLGAGSTLKLAHNVMVYLGYLAVIEAVELAHAAGVADGLVKEVTLASETLSRQSEVFLDIYERRRLDPGRRPSRRSSPPTRRSPTRTCATPSRWPPPTASTCPGPAWPPPWAALLPGRPHGRRRPAARPSAPATVPRRAA